MLHLDSIYNHLGPFLMVLFRLSGLFVFGPLLASSIIPLRVRALLAFVFTLAIYPTIPAAQQVPIHLDLFSLAPAIFAETLVGVAIGLLAALPMFAAQLGGTIMSQQAGITLGQIFNPALDIEADVFGQLLQYVAIFAFISLGGLELLFLALAGTFARVPVGCVGATIAPLDLVVGLAGSGFEVALRVSAPVLCIILIETIASAVLMKTIPQINIQSLGFATKIVAAFLALIGGIVAIDHAIHDDTARTAARILDWSRTLPSPLDAPIPHAVGGR